MKTKKFLWEDHKLPFMGLIATVLLMGSIALASSQNPDKTQAQEMPPMENMQDMHEAPHMQEFNDGEFFEELKGEFQEDFKHFEEGDRHFEEREFERPDFNEERFHEKIEGDFERHDFDKERFEDEFRNGRENFDRDREFDDRDQFHRSAPEERFDENREEFEDFREKEPHNFEEREFDEREDFRPSAEDDERNRMEKERQSKEAQRNLRDKARMVKEMERECRRNECAGGSENVIGKLKQLHSEMERAAQNEDFNLFWDLNRDFDDKSQDFWDQMQDKFYNEDLRRWLNDIERQIRDSRRMVKDVARSGDQSLISKVEAIVDRMTTLHDQASRAYDAQDYEKVQDLLEFDFRDLQDELMDLMEDFHENREKEFVGRDIEHMEKEFDRAEKRLARLLESGDIEPSKAEECKGYISRGRSLMSKMKVALEAEDFDGVEDIRFEMEDLGHEAERNCREALDYEPDYEGFNEVYIDEGHHDVAEDVFRRVNKDVVNQVMSQMKDNAHLFNQVLESGGEDFQGQIAKMMEVTTFIPEEFQQELMSRKAALLDQVEEMKKLTSELKELKKIAVKELNELSQVREKIANYNFVGAAGDAIQEEVESFIQQAQEGDLSEAEIRSRVHGLKTQAEKKIKEAREEKFERGIIPFRDADDDQWFTRFAADAKAAGLVKGTGTSGGSELNPGGTTNVAEAIALFGRVVGENQGAQPNSAVGKRLPGWAKAAAATLEARGVDLGSIFGSQNAGDSVTRGQVARLMQQVFALSGGDASGFADINEASGSEREAIGAVNAAGIMSGEGDGSRFNSRGQLNRAALVKVLMKAKELSN